jgi:hypothetical protein
MAKKRERHPEKEVHRPDPDAPDGPQEMVWRCQCGQSFPESGDGEGYRALFSHIRTDHGGMQAMGMVEGLFDRRGIMLVRGPDMRNAVRLGYVKKKDAGRGGQEARTASTTRVRMKLVDVDLDPALWILFDLARLKWPDDYDDTPQSFARWVEECIFTFYAEHASELGFDILLAKSIERLKIKEEMEWGSQVS